MKTLLITICAFALFSGCNPTVADAERFARGRLRRTVDRQLIRDARVGRGVDLEFARAGRGRVGVDFELGLGRSGFGRRGAGRSFGDFELGLGRSGFGRRGAEIGIGGRCGFDRGLDFSSFRGRERFEFDSYARSGIDIESIARLLSLRQTPTQIFDIPFERQTIEFVPQIRREIINQRLVIPGQTIIGGY